MKTKDFLKKHSACIDGATWALSISGDMVDVWDAMLSQKKWEWLIWTATRPGVFPDSSLRKIACRFVRETPLTDGRKVWDLLTDERSRRAVEVAESYADGKATAQELDSAHAAAYDSFAAYSTYAADAASYAARAARDAARDARDAARAASYAADAASYAAAADARASAYDAAKEAAKAAQVRMIAELGNPFKERATK